MKQARFMVELHKVREEMWPSPWLGHVSECGAFSHMARMKKSEEEKLRRKIRREYKDMLVKRV